MATIKDIDFDNVKDIKILEGAVKYIDDIDEEGNPRCIWKRPLSIGTNALTLHSKFTTPNGLSAHIIAFSNLMSDPDGRTMLVNVPSSENSTYYYGIPVLWLPIDDDVVDENDYTSSFTWVKLGQKENSLYLTGHHISNATLARNFPLTSNNCNAQKFSLVYYNTTDSTKIKLYAIPSKNITPQWDACVLRLTDALHGEYEWQTPSHITDVDVATTTPMFTTQKITIAGTQCYEINSIRSNFDDYKTAYDKATGGQFPKSIYPYLVGIMQIRYACGQKEGNRLAVAFKVKR